MDKHIHNALASIMGHYTLEQLARIAKMYNAHIDYISDEWLALTFPQGDSAFRFTEVQECTTRAFLVNPVTDFTSPVTLVIPK